MARVSKTGKLIAQNQKLASLPIPYSEYYPYYTLGHALRLALEEFLKTEQHYFDTMDIAYGKSIEHPPEASVFLPFLEDQTIEGILCDHFRQFLHILMGNKSGFGDRSKIKSYDFSKIDAIVNHHEFDAKDKNLSSQRIQEFWLRAKKCVTTNSQPKHTDLDFMDLLSAFCGYTNFESYLNAQFGLDYQKDEDTILLSLLDGHPLTTNKNEGDQLVGKEPPRELVPNAVSEPKTQYFLGREEELLKITEQLLQNGTLLIHAEGGMGKTTVAAAFYHRSIRNKSYKTVAWLFCEQGTMKAIFELAHLLDLNFHGVSEKDRLLMIQHRLKGMEEDFLLVLDNVEDDLTEFMMAFQGFRWHVLVTGRGRLNWEGVQNYELPALSNPAAKALFKIHYQDSSGTALESGAEFEELLEKLISAIGFNTLLIEIFAKQLREEFWGQEGERFGLREFLERLEMHGLYLEDNLETVNTNYAFYRRKTNLATTTDILDILHDFSKLDKHLNSLLINLALLPTGEHRVEVLYELFQPDSKRLFRSNLKKLYAKGWIGGDGSDLFGMSPVIQDLAIKKHQERLWEEGKEMVERVRLLIEEEPDKDNFYTKFKWWPIAEKLAIVFDGYSEKQYFIFLKTFAILLRGIGGNKNLVNAAYVIEYVLAFEIKNSGHNTPFLTSCMSVFGLVLKDLGGHKNLARALIELENALVLSLRNAGNDSHISASIRSNIAMVLKDLGGHKNLERAFLELELALVSFRKILGDSDPVIATIRLNLAIILEHLNGDENLKRAELELGKALEIGIANFGEDSPLVATIRSSSASLMQDLGERNNILRSVAELEKAMASDIKNFGMDAPVISLRRSNLALGLKELGGPRNLNRAEVELGKALVLAIKNFGENSPKIATIRSNLSCLLQHIGGPKNLNRALLEIEKALDLAIKIFGDDSPNVAIIRSNLSGILKDIGGPKNFARAIEEIERALHYGLKHHGAASIVVAKRRLTLGLVLKDIGGIPNLMRSAAELDNSLGIFLLTSGPDSAIVANIRSILATVLADLGGFDNLKRSVAEFEILCEFMTNTHGKDASEVAIIRSNLAMALKGIGGSENLNRAKDELEIALDSDLANFGAEAPSVATCRSNLALVLRDLGGYENLKRAAKELEISLTSDVNNFGEEASQTVIPRLNLAAVLYDLHGKNNLLLAQNLLLEAFPLAIRHYGESHPLTTAVKSYLKKTQEVLG
ncbi:tetratricopeptide repeat protein [Lunatibacter salilacus]|uniref:tetratricopeptide repeat protein n=1 Tax=Lunatibacter salilacus TaxID=2483804 RepID=UPI00131BC7CA|nr:tetratricopeptide repeat protein [Lunatibacter salilacus]